MDISSIVERNKAAANAHLLLVEIEKDNGLWVGLSLDQSIPIYFAHLTDLPNALSYPSEVSDIQKREHLETIFSFLPQSRNLNDYQEICKVFIQQANNYKCSLQMPLMFLAHPMSFCILKGSTVQGLIDKYTNLLKDARKFSDTQAHLCINSEHISVIFSCLIGLIAKVNQKLDQSQIRSLIRSTFATEFKNMINAESFGDIWEALMKAPRSQRIRKNEFLALLRSPEAQQIVQSYQGQLSPSNSIQDVTFYLD